MFTYTVLHLPHFCHLLTSWLLAQIPTHLIHNLIYAHDFNSHLKLMSSKDLYIFSSNLLLKLHS